ncbi:hypothetical protein [Pseudomonas mangiferae]|uniref:Uncharacterized protein n=1 Tax=Pseudomonas mangiferae TaxID=2593654 RepID=A0A553H0V2_9PSED|nr:hypothetical protein [Pseudomonas mangiferae]TRX75372.1 hypothetical protein FM069_06425 [Pseudomonas mangiferae]
MNTIAKYSDEIRQHLLHGGFDDEAGHIRQLTHEVLDEQLPAQTRRKAAVDLIDRCHVRWLGDYYIPDIDYNAWGNLLTRFAKALNTFLRT